MNRWYVIRKWFVAGLLAAGLFTVFVNTSPGGWRFSPIETVVFSLMGGIILEVQAQAIIATIEKWDDSDE